MFRASAGKICSLSHTSRGRSSASPRNMDMGVWVCPFTSPGIIIPPQASICIAPFWARSLTCPGTAGPQSAILPCLIWTNPFSITGRPSSMVKRMPLCIKKSFFMMFICCFYCNSMVCEDPAARRIQHRPIYFILSYYLHNFFIVFVLDSN